MKIDKNNVLKVKPVLRYPGSKYKKINKIFSFIPENTKTFIDMFGGSGIIGVNAKHLLKIDIVINDYDEIFPLTDNFVIKNMLSFAGLGKNYTKMANDYFLRRIKNGYWDKLDFYNKILDKCQIIHKSFQAVVNKEEYDPKSTFIYVDPPYYGVYGLYKSDFNINDHINLRDTLNELSNLGFKILISYNCSPFIKDLYKNWKIFEENFTYTSGRTNKNKITKEILISN